MADYFDLPVMGSSGWFGFDEGAAEGLRYETLSLGRMPAPVPLPASIWGLGLALGGLGRVRGRRHRTA